MGRMKEYHKKYQKISWQRENVCQRQRNENGSRERGLRD